MAKPSKLEKLKKKRKDDDDDMEEEDEELSDIVDEEDNDDEGDDQEEEEAAPRGKKKRKSALIDDAAEEDDDDDEEEDAGPSRRVKRNRFIDDIAAVDEDEEDEEEDDEVDDLIHDEGEELPDERDIARVYRRVEADQRARDTDMSPEELEEYVKRRFEQRSGFDSGDMGEEQAGVVGQQGLLPTHEDPKLWLVELKAGTEREAVICLMQKAVDFAAKGTPLLIKSAFVQDHLKGYMYVEAYKEAHVKEAIRGLRVFYQSKGAKLVPTREMVDAITVNRKAKAQLDVGSWVRPRAGMYKMDLGQVADIDYSTNRCTVRLIPRLDYTGMAQRRDDGTRALPFGRAPPVRPPAKAFSAAEAKEHRLNVEKKVRRDAEGGYVYYLNSNMQQYYVDGYLNKTVSIKSLLQIEGVPPVEELTRFNQVGLAARKQDGETNGELATLMQTLGADEEGRQRTAVTYNKGDAVMVTEGDLKTMLGRVVNVGDDGKIYVLPQIKGLDVLPFDPSQLTKYFKSGDHVKVVNGSAAGQTGMVVSVDTTTNICIILTDAHKEELRIFARDLSESNDTVLANDTWGDYELHNLVALDQSTVGVIVSIEADSTRILTSNVGVGGLPEVRVCKPVDVKRKLFQSKATNTHDRAQNSVSAGDIVDIKEGPMKDRSGTVKFVYRRVLFLHSKDIPDNGGYVCVRGQQCLLRGGARTGGVTALGSSIMSFRSPAPHRFGAANGVNASPRREGPSGMSGSNAFGAHPTFSGRTLTHRDDGIVGLDITIAKGPNKGYKGRVISATASHVRMELQAQYKTVNVERKFLPAEYAGPQPRRPAGFGPGMGHATPHHAGARTPLHAGSATPLHSSWGSATPLHPSMTPLHPGSQTPGRDNAWNPGAQTPRHHPVMDDAHADTPAQYYGQAGTPGYNAPYTPAETPAATPGGTDLGNMPGTPAFDAAAGTPYNIATGTPGYNAPTPSYPTGTPGYGGTPAYGETPGMPTPMGGLAHTPGTPGYEPMSPGMGETGGAEEVTDWELYTGIAVALGDGKIGVVRSADPSGQCQVVPARELEDGSIEADRDGEPMTMEGPQLQTAELVKKNMRVKIVRGESRGMYATCIATNFPDGIIKLRNEEVRVLDLANLARAEGPTNAA